MSVVIFSTLDTVSLFHQVFGRLQVSFLTSIWSLSTSFFNFLCISDSLLYIFLLIISCNVFIVLILDDMIAHENAEFIRVRYHIRATSSALNPVYSPIRTESRSLLSRSRSLSENDVLLFLHFAIVALIAISLSSG